MDMVMNLDVPREIIMDRLTDRWIHPGSGRVYAYAYRPPQVWAGFSPFSQALTCEPCDLFDSQHNYFASQMSCLCLCPRLCAG